MEPLSLDAIECRLHSHNENINRRVTNCFATACTTSNDHEDSNDVDPAGVLRQVLEDIGYQDTRLQERCGAADSKDSVQDTYQEAADLNHDTVEVSAKAAVRIYKAKLTAEKVGLESLKVELQQSQKQTNKLAKELEQAKVEKIAFQKLVKALESESGKAKRALEELKNEAKAKDEEIRRLTHGLNQAENSKRASETDGKAKQKRLSRALLDLENYKALLEEAKATVSTANMVPRAELDKSVADVQKLERQKNDLVSAVRKQARLIEVLKRQKLHLEASRLLDFNEKEFLKAVETQPA